MRWYFEINQRAFSILSTAKFHVSSLMKRPCVLARYDELPVGLATATATERDGNNKTKRRPKARSADGMASRQREWTLRETQPAINIQSISIPSIRSQTGLPFGTRMMLTRTIPRISRTAAWTRGGGRAPQTTRYRVDNPPGQTAMNVHAALSALERRNFERNYRCTYSHVRNRCTKRP